MGDDVADLVFTDPPYRMAAEGGSAQPVGRAAAKLGESIKHLLDFDPPAFLEVLPSVFKRSTLNAYIFCNKDLVPDYLDWARAKGYAFNILFWKKPMAIPLGGQHRPDVEYLLFFRKQGVWMNAVDGANYSKCLDFPREESADHPTLKPVNLIANEVLISSRPGSVVVDFFGGAGSTMIACQTTSRRCLSIELDPGYVDVAVKRWQDFSKGEATLEGDGRTFAEVARARLKGKREPATAPKAAKVAARRPVGRVNAKEAAE
jgi:DNA modification methylase